MSIKQFFKDERGNFAVIAALCTIPLCVAGGLAMDYSTKSAKKTKLQDAVDAAVLAAGRDMAKLDNKEVKQLVRRFVRANLDQADVRLVRNIQISIDRKDMRLQATATASVPTTFGQLAGIDNLKYEAAASVQSAFGGIEVVLVLDNTGSMKADGKLDALKTAATAFMSDMMQANAHDDIVKIGLVPFGQYVNVGLHNRNANWLDVPDDSSENTCWQTRDVISKSGCRKETRTSYSDGVPRTRQVEVCSSYEYSEPYEKCGTRDVRWNGCVGSRQSPLNLQDSRYSKRVPGLMNVSCPGPVLELTADETRLSNSIASMKASGNTYLPSGLIWGWRAISSNRPFKGGASKAQARNRNITKAIVLMTDGENTKSKEKNGPRHNKGDKEQSDTWTAQMCETIKSEEIVIYSMSFGADIGTQTKTLLSNCASTPQNYFHASDANALNAAFSDIAASLNRLYLTQ